MEIDPVARRDDNQETLNLKADSLIIKFNKPF